VRGVVEEDQVYPKPVKGKKKKSKSGH